MAREERRRVQVVLQQGLGNDDVADPRRFVQAAGGAGEDRALGAELVDEQRRRHCRGDLADAREDDDDVLAVEMAEPEFAPREDDRRLVGHRRQQCAELLLHGGGDGDATHRASIAGARRRRESGARGSVANRTTRRTRWPPGRARLAVPSLAAERPFRLGAPGSIMLLHHLLLHLHRPVRVLRPEPGPQAHGPARRARRRVRGEEGVPRAELDPVHAAGGQGTRAEQGARAGEAARGGADASPAKAGAGAPPAKLVKRLPQDPLNVFEMSRPFTDTSYDALLASSDVVKVEPGALRQARPRRARRFATRGFSAPPTLPSAASPVPSARDREVAHRPPSARRRREAIDAQRAERAALERLDPIADGSDHSLHLVVLAFGQRQPQRSRSPLASQAAARTVASSSCSSTPTSRRSIWPGSTGVLAAHLVDLGDVALRRGEPMDQLRRRR